MRAAMTTLAAGVLLTGCAPKGHVSQVRVPGPTMQPVMQRQIRNALDAGEGNPRVRELRAQMAAQPQNVKLRLELAAEYAKAGHTDLEMEHLLVAVERFPDSEVAVLALTRWLVRAERPAEAAQRVGSYLARQEKPSANALSWAAIAQDGMGHWTEGEPLHRRAVERAPGRDTLHNNLGYNLMMQGRGDDAAVEFRRALALNPGSETARNNLGLALGDQPAAAISEFRQAADLAVAHNNLAAYLYEKGDVAGARKELETALDYRPDMPRILENLRKLSAADGVPIRAGQPEERSVWKLVAWRLKHTFRPGEEKHSTGNAEADR